MPGILSNSNGNKFKTVLGLSSHQTAAATTTVTANHTDLDDGDDELLAIAAASSSSSPPTKSLKSLESNRSSKSFTSFRTSKSSKSPDPPKDSYFASSPLSSWNKSRSRGRKLRARIIAPQDNRAAELDSATPNSTTAAATTTSVTVIATATTPAGPAAANTEHQTPNEMPSSIDIRPSRLARPVRMDAQDGPWSVSVAEAPPRGYTIYIKTPTHHLTLTRSAHEISELHGKIQDQLPAGTVLPVCPLEAEPPQKRKSSFLTTLSRFASPPRQIPTQLALSQDEDPDPFLAAEPSATSLASYLTTLSNEPNVRVSRPWKRFVRVRTDDLESTRVERAIKRVRSDIAVHGGGAPLSSTAPPSSRTSTASAEQDGDHHPKLIGRDSNALSGQDITEEDEGTEHTHRAGYLAPPALTPDDASAEENARRLIASGMVDFSLPEEPPSRIVEEPKKAQVEPEPIKDAQEVYEAHEVDEQHEMEEVQETEEIQHDQAMAERKEEHPAKIPRSMSADPDKAARLSRVWKDSSVAPAQSENEMDVDVGETPDATDAEDTDAFAGATSDAGGENVKRSRKKKQKAERKSKKVTIDDFEMMRVLGKGCAGKVLLVRYKRSEGLYALKAITKRHVLAHQELQHTMTEQAVLKRMARSNNDPFVVKLYWSFHDKENLFLVMDFHPGGDLATQLARWGRLGRDRARFYAAEIVEGCEGLHAAGVIYRDLKPENILIGGDGHIVLTDFGLSKEFPRRRPSSHNPNTEKNADVSASSPSTPTGGSGLPYWMSNDNSRDSWLITRANDTTTTFCGTAEYLAPEVIQGLPYSYEVDWWSFGTMLYEMLTGITPFWANNHSDMYVRVLQDELTFPEDKAMDQDTKSLIRGLLQRNPALRLCEPRIKRHPYFSMIDWSHVCHKRYIPPYIPPIDPANASDTQNFDDTFLEMEPVLDTDLENDDQTGSERDRSTTDVDIIQDEESAQASASGGSPSVEPELANDAFDGYSFKARNSVLIDDEDGYEGSEGSEEERSMAPPAIEEEPAEEELDAGQKTPDAHAQAASGPTPASAVAEAFRKKQEQEHAKSPTSPKAAPEEIDIDEENVPSIEDEEEPAPPKTPQKKTNDLPARSPPASPEKKLPKPPVPENVNTAAANANATAAVSAPPPTPPKTEKKTVTISEKPKTKPLEVPKGKARNIRTRRERSGVAALDRDLSDVAASDEETPLDREDDDWDFIEALEGEEHNGQQGKSLFARGVVDRYRLKVFRKPSTNALSSKSSSQRNPPSNQSVPTASESEFGEISGAASPTLSEKKRGRGGGLSLRKPRTFLRPKSPPATYSAGSRKSNRPALATQPATISSGSGGLLLTPAASTPMSIAGNGTTSLKSQPSMQSVGSPGSSDNSINGTEFSKASLAQSAAEFAPSPGKSRSNKSSPDLRRQAKNSTPDVDDPRQKGLKKMRKYTEQGAEKVMSLFSSPRPSQTPIP